MGPRPHHLTREQAARVAVRAQLLSAERPVDALEVIRHLGFLQVDLTSVVVESAELVVWSRLGTSYEMGGLAELMGDGRVIELDAHLRPAEDIALFQADMASWPGMPPRREWMDSVADWVAANDGCRREIIAILRAEGPLPARELPDTCAVPWRSTGWTNNKNVMKLLECMARRGEVAVASRQGRERHWDLAERVFPGDETVPAEQAHRILAERRLRALGIARPRSVEAWHEPFDLGAVGEEARVEGVRGRWVVDPDQLDADFAGRAAILSPLDRLVFDRKRIAELFDFDYQLEMYKPAASRRWGYWAMPVLWGSSLVGKVDATADREAGVLMVDAVHEDGDWTRRVRADVHHEIDALAAWLGLEVARA